MENASYLETLKVHQLNGVGPKLAEKLAKLGITNLQDLVFHLPSRYQDRTRITAIARLQTDHEALIEGEVLSATIQYGRRRSLICRIKDSSGVATLRFFHFSAAQKNSLSEGSRLRCYGEAKWGRDGIELYHPEYSKISSDSKGLPETLTAVYPATEGVSQNLLRKLVAQALMQLKKGCITEYLPELSLPGIAPASLEETLLYLHQPPPDAAVELLREGKHPFQLRLAFEELLAHHLSLLRIRELTRQQQAPAMIRASLTAANPGALFGFELTNAQERVWQELQADLRASEPMMRLVQGDVGAGKTAVAALAALQAIANGYQVALMAPTEILAEQHYATFSAWFEPLSLSTVWLTGRVKGKRRREVLSDIKSAQAQLVVGTHALFQDEVKYGHLGLIIIDEQHRFGVHQRLALREKGHAMDAFPHQLIMTATPIPRTLAMSAYADLDVSVIDELPPGRQPVKTAVVDNARRQAVVERVMLACQQGRQAYWVCTLIEESEALQCQAAEATALELQEFLPDLQVGLVHGRLKAEEKASVMAAFESGQCQLLVATTVIEVGVNVPNASLMIIENPERLGLAQLHQLRGRVGRGAIESHCILLYKPPLSLQGKERLAVLRDTNDGFIIAEKDLELRGPGDVLGTRQTGLMEFKIADIQRDAHLLPPVKALAQDMMMQNAPQIIPLLKRWLGQREIFINV